MLEEEEEEEEIRSAQPETLWVSLLHRQLQVYNTGPPDRMSHRIWRSTKHHPSRARAGYQIGCCLPCWQGGLPSQLSIRP